MDAPPPFLFSLSTNLITKHNCFLSSHRLKLILCSRLCIRCAHCFRLERTFNRKIKWLSLWATRKQKLFPFSKLSPDGDDDIAHKTSANWRKFHAFAIKFQNTERRGWWATLLISFTTFQKFMRALRRFSVQVSSQQLRQLSSWKMRNFKQP